MDQWYEMTRARSLTEFKAALGRVAIPYMNITYADRDGNIFYLYNGAVPRRSTKFDWRSPVDGSDPETEWQGYHPPEDLPQLTNPAAGFVQNCNSTPFATTVDGNPDPARFPAYMIGPEADNPPRPGLAPHPRPARRSSPSRIGPAPRSTRGCSKPRRSSPS